MEGEGRGKEGNENAIFHPLRERSEERGGGRRSGLVSSALLGLGQEGATSLKKYPSK